MLFDLAEARADGLAKALLTEAQAADIVLISKLDLLAEKDRQQLIETLLKQGLMKVMRMDRGKFDLTQLGDKSQILDYLLLHESAENVAENVFRHLPSSRCGLAFPWRALLRRGHGDSGGSVPDGRSRRIRSCRGGPSI